MNYEEFVKLFAQLPKNYKNKDIEDFDKCLIREQIDVSFLKDFLPEHQEYYKTYFEVSLARIKGIDDKLSFIESHFHLFNDWWHADLFYQILGKALNFETAFAKSQNYIQNMNPIVRRLGYIMFIPRLTRDIIHTEQLLSLLQNDNEDYVVSAEASLISFLAISAPEVTYNYLNKCTLNSKIIKETIKKIRASRQIPEEIKSKYKTLIVG